MKKKILLFILTILVIPVLTACSDEQVSKADLDSLQVTSENSSLQQTLDVNGEIFKLICNYDTGNYNIQDWRITDSKTLSLNVKTDNLDDSTEVFIEHVHCDINIKSTLAVVDGLQQDEMDDVYHFTNQQGFYIDNKNTYNSIFAIEGYSKTLIDGWGFVCGSYGSTSISEKRMTEENLIKNGKAYAQKVQIVYDLSVRKKGDTYFHTVSVVSEFLVPLNIEKYNATKQTNAQKSIFG